MNVEVEAQKKVVDDLLEQRKQDAIAQSKARTSNANYTKRERGLRVQPAADPLVKAEARAIKMRAARCSLRREQTRSKIRERVH